MGLLVFAQAAFALRPCVDADMSAASAVAATQEHDCCETEVANANLCVLECTDELTAYTPLSIPFAANHLIRILSPEDAERTHRIQPMLDDRARDPPKSVRFCSFQV